jgi:hypothetical protein
MFPIKNKKGAFSAPFDTNTNQVTSDLWNSIN